MESIKTWLESGCDYNQGVQLYASLPGANANLLRLFKKGYSLANAEKLKYELKKRLASPPAPKGGDEHQGESTYPLKTTLNPKEVPLPEHPRSTPLYHQLPAELRDVLLEAHELFTKNCLLKANLNDLAPEQEDEALAIQKQIFDNRQQNQRCWAKIDHWQRYKTIPVAPVAQNPFKDCSPAELLKKEGNLQSSISKLKKRYALNEAELEAATTVAQKTKLDRALAKQGANLLRQERDLELIRTLIKGHG